MSTCFFQIRGVCFYFFSLGDALISDTHMFAYNNSFFVEGAKPFQLSNWHLWCNELIRKVSWISDQFFLLEWSFLSFTYTEVSVRNLAYRKYQLLINQRGFRKRGPKGVAKFGHALSYTQNRVDFVDIGWPLKADQKLRLEFAKTFMERLPIIINTHYLSESL